MIDLESIKEHLEYLDELLELLEEREDNTPMLASEAKALVRDMLGDYSYNAKDDLEVYMYTHTYITPTELKTLLEKAYKDEIELRCDLIDYGQGSNWYRENLIHEDNFDEYAEELHMDIYYDVHKEIERAGQASYVKLDVSLWAHDIALDYTSIDYQGETYYIV